MPDSCPYCQSVRAHGLFRLDDAFRAVRCRGCGVVRYDPMPTAAQLEAVYRDAWERDDSRYRTEYLDDARVDLSRTVHFTPHLETLEAHVPKGDILDVGCSSGAFLELAVERGWTGHGCDLGEGACKAAAERTGCDVRHGTLETLDFASEQFMAVHAAQVIEHVLDPAAFVEAAKRILRPGGGLFIAAPVIEPRVFWTTYHAQQLIIPRVSRGREFAFPWAIDHPFHILIPTARALEALLDAHGFDVVWKRLVPWQIFDALPLKWRVYYRVMNLVFRTLRTGMNVEMLAVRRPQPETA